MMPTANGRRGARRHSLERELAPHLDATWAEAFILELRLRDVPGPAIGQAVTEADTHCLDSGQSAQEAFGDPEAYARSLDLPAEPPSSGSLLGAAAPALAQVLGMLALLWSFGDLRHGEALQLTTGHLVTAGLLVTGVVALALLADPIVRAVVHHPVVVWCVLMVLLGLFVVLALLLDQVVLSVPAGWGVVGGAAALGGGLLWELRRRGDVDDPIRTPFGGTAGAPVTWQRWFLAASRLMVPIWTVVMLAAIWWFTR